MSGKRENESVTTQAVDRRQFMSGAIGVAGVGAAALAATTAAAMQAPTPPGPPRPLEPTPAPPGAAQRSDIDQRYAPPPARGPKLFRAEIDVTDCEVEGKIPADLNGAFYRTGPDAQYPLHAGNIPFDGEGHVSMFRIENGRVSFRSRFVRNERYLAQEKAGKILFPMYRNPYMDDPSVKGLTRGTHNTHIIHHNGLLLALKEDSPPAAMDLNTLATVDPVYTFGGQLPRTQPFTAHPKTDSKTGNMLAFGYEARGFGSDQVNVFEITRTGQKIWDATVTVPYVGMLHDFQMTENFVVLYVIPLAMDQAQIQRGGIHWSWYPGQPTYFGYFRRGGDGKDIKWIKGPERSATHMMGGFDDGKKIYVDVEMSLSNPFPFMPMRDGSRWDPIRGASHITRLSADLTKKTPKDYGIETLYPDFVGALPRQDDRYNTMPYRIGFLPTQDPDPAAGERPRSSYARMDHATRKVQMYKAPAGGQLAECCFAPKSKTAPEGSGYLMGVCSYAAENGRADLVILDAEQLEQGPIATVKLPTRIVGQIHGWWAPADSIPQRT